MHQGRSSREGRHTILRESKDGQSFGDHPTPTQEEKIIPWWIKRGTKGIEKQSFGGPVKAKGMRRSSNKTSPVPSRRGGSKSKKTAQLTKLGGGNSRTLQLIRHEAGVVVSNDGCLRKDTVKTLSNTLSNAEGIESEGSNEPVKTTFQSIDCQNLSDKLRFIEDRLALYLDVTSDGGNSGSAGID